MGGEPVVSEQARVEMRTLGIDLVAEPGAACQIPGMPPPHAGVFTALARRGAPAGSDRVRDQRASKACSAGCSHCVSRL